MQKYDLAYVCHYYKNLVIPHTPEDFTVAERFRHGLTDLEIRKGIAAFREFLYALFDKLAADKEKIDVETGSNYDLYGDTGAKGSGNINHCFPVIIDLALTLFSLGFHGRLETGAQMKLTVQGVDMLTVICPVTEKYHSLIRMSGRRKLEIFLLLHELGLRFEGADFSKEVDFSKTGAFHITYDKDDCFAAGLKLIAEATANNREYIKLENLFGTAFMRCDFYPLANAAPRKHVKYIQEYVNAQSPEIREWIRDLDVYLSGSGCTVTHDFGGEFIYAKRKLRNRMGMVCKIYMDITGCFITPGMNHLKNPNNIINMLPGDIVDLMIAKAERECGWCAYSRRNPDSIECRPGCPLKFTYKGEEYIKCRYAEFQIPLDKAENRELIRKWLEMELAV
jgi:hypothetical protein